MNYEKLDLKNDDDLKQACETVREKRPDWKAAIVAFLHRGAERRRRNPIQPQIPEKAMEREPYFSAFQAVPQDRCRD